MSSAARAKRLTALQALKAKRTGGNRTASTSADEDDGDLYDEVSEQEYKSILRGRMMADDFIEDDDGSGYVDDGRNEWEDSAPEHSDEEDEDDETEADYFERTGRKKPKKKKKKKNSGTGAKAKKGSSSATGPASLANAFARQPAGKGGISATASARRAAEERSAAAMDAYRPKVSREKEEDFMKRLMGGLDPTAAAAAAAGTGAAPGTPTPSSAALRGYPGRPSGYGMLSGGANTPGSLSRKRPYASPNPILTRGPSVTYRSEKRHYPSSPSEETSAPSSDLADPSSDGLAPHVHVSGSDTPPWHPKGGLGSDDGDVSADLSLETISNKKHKSSRGVLGEIGTLGLQQKRMPSVPRPKALRMETGGLSDEEDEDVDFAVQAPKQAAAAANRKRRMNVNAESAAPATPTKADVQSKENAPRTSAEVQEEETDEQTPNAQAAQASWKSINATLNTVTTAVAEASPTASPNAAAAQAQAQAGSSSSSGNRVDALNDDKTLPFYWMDHIELDAGIILLIGKVKDRATGKYVSACLRVEGIERCVFLLLRDRKLENGHETDAQPTEDDVYDEFDEVREKHGIKNFLAKTVTRHYAFECPGVPATGSYFKVKYGFDEPALPETLTGRTFSRAFGTQTSAMELFLIKRKIMGPCWLKVSSVDVLDPANGHKPLSWCKAEYSIDDAKFLAPYPDSAGAAQGADAAAVAQAAEGESASTSSGESPAPKELPPLTISSLAIRTVHNHQANRREIVAISLRTWSDAQLEDVRPPEERPSSIWTAVRPLAGQWPVGFEAEIRKQGGKVKAIKWERALLNGLLAQLQLLDPDIVLSHDFSASDLDVLLARMRELRVDHWSRIGRFRRPGWPKLRNGWNLSLMKGRLCCDLSSDVGKSMITSTTWSLTEMVGTHLKVTREDIDPDDVPSYFDATAPNPRQLLTFVQHCEVDTFFLMSIAHKVQILPLTKQLTNLAGNTWARTLSGGRAERNEYILLHDFHRRKFIVPDKVASGKRAAAAKAAAAAEAEAEDGAESKAAASSSKKSKKDKFKGGLVFDPKRGLWDRYVLVMDFNSLYPSIIQEYNIDFTTVDRARFNAVGSDEDAADADTDGVPDIPSSDVGQGVLPNLIAKLVERRRQVKSLMKDKRAPAHKQLQWNVKQLALKLTANSMYGCLGFEGSRFYARPLAALTTFKGREILTATKELAESFGLDVIYGDTDSVMINTNAMTYAQAARIGADFKKAVNERYKLLEIDTDAVFERMLLLQKKKYAARKVEEVEVLPNGEEKKRVSTEIKGLDMKRREYSALSKNVSSYVLEQILSGESTENVVEAIHTYLSEVGEAVRNAQIPLEDFIIFKRLGKDPKAYGANLSGQPHVHVALKMLEKGQGARMGDVIPYIFCLGSDGGSSTRSAQADRAHHPDEVRRQGSELKVDYEHYLALQILPPIERLCESIQGTERARLAECLGLDPARYGGGGGGGGAGGAGVTAADRDFASLDSQTPDEVRFAKCERLRVRCPRCRHATTFEGLVEAASASVSTGSNGGMLRPDGLVCPRCPSSDSSSGSATASPFPPAALAAQLELAIRRHIARYYSAWQVCTEPSCGARTRLTGVYARRCVAKGCHRGVVAPEYGDKALYDQLCYYASLVDVEGAREKVRVRASAGAGKGAGRGVKTEAGAGGEGTAAEEEALIRLKVLLRNSDVRQALELLERTAGRYLERNGRRFVDLGKIFGRGRAAAGRG